MRQPYLFNLLLTATPSVVSFPVVVVGITGGTKFCRGKIHRPEKTAGIILFGSYTFLVGNTVFCSIYEVLSRTYYSYYRKNSKRYGDISGVVAVIKCAGKSRRNILGYIIAAAAATVAAVIVCFSYFSVEYYGIDYLYYCYGDIFA